MIKREREGGGGRERGGGGKRERELRREKGKRVGESSFPPIAISTIPNAISNSRHKMSPSLALNGLNTCTQQPHWQY